MDQEIRQAEREGKLTAEQLIRSGTITPVKRFVIQYQKDNNEWQSVQTTSTYDNWFITEEIVDSSYWRTAEAALDALDRLPIRGTSLRERCRVVEIDVIVLPDKIHEYKDLLRIRQENSLKKQIEELERELEKIRGTK